ncbi:MAG: quinone-dependent dihydroorotate dehydrogenase [Alphaproteobacteria bacterium]
MTLYEAAGLRLLHLFDPETAHGLSLRALQAGLVPLPGPYTSPRLQTDLAGLSLLNPIGLAAGYDKNGTAIEPLSRAGFGFVEVGAATPRAQPGNPRPRLFRLTEDGAAINRFGFNNDGASVIASRLRLRKRGKVPVGLNLGANKDSRDRAKDFTQVLAQCGPYVDFATVNVSSPNTERLRDLQGRAALTALLVDVVETNRALAKPVPVFLKIAPDLAETEIAEIAETALETGLSGIIATNTTLDRKGLKSASRDEKGGLSGSPLFEKSTRVLAQLSHLTAGKIPLIGVGGVCTAQDAYAKIRAGASAVQFYTAMVYQGLSLAARMARDLDALLQQDGFANVSHATGTGRDIWL